MEILGKACIFVSLFLYCEFKFLDFLCADSDKEKY